VAAVGRDGAALLIARANTASLFLVRADNRRREVAVRLALGAGARHVALLFLTESLAITAARQAWVWSSREGCCGR
jgi:ABC-type antimicrobial peptide transport system permease subunit